MDDKYYMDEDQDYEARREARRRRRMKEQMLRKRRQLMIRKATRLAAVFLAAVLVVTLLFQFAVKPLMKKTGSGDNANVVQVQAEPQQTETVMAKRMPVKDGTNIAKASNKAVGWQENQEGIWYQNADGSYYAGGLLELDEGTYYLDENGYRQSGWVTVDGKDRFFKEDGTEDATAKRKMIALTFDDGPGKYTMELLDCLEENGAKATFFMQGINAEQYPEEIRRMKELGCELGNHSYNHPQLTTISGEQVSEQFQKTSDIVQAACGAPTTVARTPFGAQDEDVLSNVGMPCFMWNIDTLDWQTLDPDNTYNVTMDNVTDGDIVLMHDIHQPTIEAALRLIPDLIEKGYKLVTVSELAAQKGVELEAGRSYTDFCEETVAQMQINDTDEEEDYEDYEGDSEDYNSEDYDSEDYDSEESQGEDMNSEDENSSSGEENYGSDEDTSDEESTSDSEDSSEEESDDYIADF